MIKFTYKIVPSKTLANVNFINWTCKWDGKHDDTWYKGPESHPFSATFEYQDQRKLYLNILEKFKTQKKSAIYVHTPNKSWDAAFGPSTKITRKEAENYNPDNMRETGDVVAYNRTTHALCKMLEDGPDIQFHSGHTDPYCYWQKLLACLMLLWD